MTSIVKVPFHGGELIAVDTADGIFAAVKPICERLGLDWKVQHRKLTARPELWGMVILTIPSAGGEQETTCLPISKLAAWLFSIHASKVKPELQAALIAYQIEAADVLDRHFRLKERDHDAGLQAAIERLDAQLDASHAYLMASSQRWSRLVPLIKGGASKVMVWKRSGLSWDLFCEEFAEMVRCGLVSDNDWFSGSPRTATEEIDRLQSDLALSEHLREKAEKKLGSLVTAEG